jgi:septum formation protein
MIIAQSNKIILASSSPIRKKILSDLGFEFNVIKPDFDEEKAKEKILHFSVKQQTLFLAKNKALSISKKYKDALVIGSDQICQLGKLTISKSNNKKEAIEQLGKMSGKIHYQNNAVCIYLNGKEIYSHFEKAKLKMRKLSTDEIKLYVNIDKSWGCAGSYKFESLGKHLFAKVEGNYEAILGMSIQPLLNYLYQKKLIFITK